MNLSDAIAAHQAGNLIEAEKLYRQFLENEPDHADANALLGVVLGQRGAYDEALEVAGKAISIDPTSGLLRFHRANILVTAKKLPEALDDFKRAISLGPDLPQLRFNFANALRATNDWQGAIAEYREALKQDPYFLDAYNNLALSLVHEKNYDEARHLAQKAVEIDKNFGDGWLTLCNVTEKLKEYDLALKAGQEAIRMMPSNHYAWFGCGVALNRLGRDEDAIRSYKKALELNSERADIWDNLAQSYQSLNRLDEAERAFRQAVDVGSQRIANENTREVDESEYGNRHWHLALIELLRGKYKEGFARYRARVNEIPELKRLSFPFPLWKGESLRNKTILVCDEQGYGDTLMLARFLPLLKQQGAKVFFSVHKVLAPLLKNWDGADMLIEHNGHVPPCDFFCSSFDLPHRLGITLETLPHEVPYLPILPIGETPRLKGKFKVGVVWGGSPLHKNDEKRSVPLPLFANIFSVSGIEFYSFNRDLKPGDTDILPSYKIHNLIPYLTDFAQASRLIGQMDLIITCDTATAHLAGGMGKKVWLMLSFAPDWRWLTERNDSPWYPTMRLFRQARPGDWASVVSDIRKNLEELVEKTKN